MVKPPKHIRIQNRVWDLVFETTPDEWGSVEPGEHIIRIDPTCQGTYLAECALHEILHAIYCDYWGVQKVSGNEEEFYAVVGSLGLVKVLHDNPRLFEWLKELLGYLR